MTSKSKKYATIALLFAVAFGLGFADFRGAYHWASGNPSSGEARGVFSRSVIVERKTRRELFAQFSPTSEFVMIGDSITARGHWNEFLPQFSLANRGIDGDTTQDVLGRMDGIVSVRPRVAFVMLGINDLSYGVGVDQVFSNYSQIVETLISNGTTPIIQSTVACSIAMCGGRNDDVGALNLKLQRYADERGVMFINLNERLATVEEGLRQDLTDDGLHLNGAGYARWIDLIEPVLNDLASTNR